MRGDTPPACSPAHQSLSLIPSCPYRLTTVFSCLTAEFVHDSSPQSSATRVAPVKHVDNPYHFRRRILTPRRRIITMYVPTTPLSARIRPYLHALCRRYQSHGVPAMNRPCSSLHVPLSPLPTLNLRPPCSSTALFPAHEFVIRISHKNTPYLPKTSIQSINVSRKLSLPKLTSAPCHLCAPSGENEHTTIVRTDPTIPPITANNAIFSTHNLLLFTRLIVHRTKFLRRPIHRIPPRLLASDPSDLNNHQPKLSTATIQRRSEYHWGPPS